jgi:hypothetical protein
MIVWNKLRDRHILGKSEHGDLWIRVDQAGKVTSLYTMFGTTEKVLPEDEEEEKVEVMKLRAEYIIEKIEFIQKLESLNNQRL